MIQESQRICLSCCEGLIPEKRIQVRQSEISVFLNGIHWTCHRGLMCISLHTGTALGINIILAFRTNWNGCWETFFVNAAIIVGTQFVGFSDRNMEGYFESCCFNIGEHFQNKVDVLRRTTLKSYFMPVFVMLVDTFTPAFLSAYGMGIDYLRFSVSTGLPLSPHLNISKRKTIKSGSCKKHE